jgi:periplasmic divalent cation tolerance protein
MTDYIQVITTMDSEDAAQAISSLLVEQKLAACVQIIGPIRSTYRWQGVVENSEEWLCLIKSRHDLFDQIETAIRSVHPHEVPEIIAVPIVAGSASYLEWLGAQVKPFD